MGLAVFSQALDVQHRCFATEGSDEFYPIWYSLFELERRFVQPGKPIF